MSTDTFRRHTRACVDTAIHRAFSSLPGHSDQAAFFERLLGAVRQRSDLMTHAPSVRGVLQVELLQNLLPFHESLVRPVEDWRGTSGHPLGVIDSLASHLFGRYPTPRFLASAWFGGRAPDRLERRRWFIEHGRGQRFRSLALPITMTRQMEHVFLRTPDHMPIDHALRRAEVLGLGGTPELADVILTTRLAEDFSYPEQWRVALIWLIQRGSSVELSQLRPFVDFLHANHEVDLGGRTFASAMRLVRDWHLSLGRSRAKLITWPHSRWHELVVPVEPTRTEPRDAEWRIVELLDSHQLAHEGRVMRHCVATYARPCAAGSSSIWSLRHRWCDETIAHSVLTVEVQPTTRMIIQVRGTANSVPRGWPLELVRRWAAREGLRFHHSVAIGDRVAVPRAA